jgi:WD40 repeat protein
MRDGRLVTGGWDNLIKIWDLTGQAPLATNLTGKL